MNRLAQIGVACVLSLALMAGQYSRAFATSYKHVALTNKDVNQLSANPKKYQGDTVNMAVGIFHVQKTGKSTRFVVLLNPGHSGHYKYAVMDYARPSSVRPGEYVKVVGTIGGYISLARNKLIEPILVCTKMVKISSSEALRYAR